MGSRRFTDGTAAAKQLVRKCAWALALKVTAAEWPHLNERLTGERGAGPGAIGSGALAYDVYWRRFTDEGRATKLGLKGGEGGRG